MTATPSDNFPPSQLHLALQYQREGRVNEAEQVYRQILQQQPEAVDALNLLGALVYQQGRFQEAIACFEQVLTLQPDNPDSYNSLGVVLKGQGKAAEAASYYRRALELRPHHPEAHNNLGNALRQLGNLNEAIAAYEQALTLKPNYPEAHNNLATALKDQGNLEQALAHYQQAIALRPGYLEAHNNLGAALQRQGKLDEAAQAYQRALTLKPNSPEICNSLGNLLQQQGKLAEAVDQHRRAIALKPDFPEAHHSLANALQQQRSDEAIYHYQQALSLRPAYPEALSNLGNALQEQGQLEQAIAHYRQALEINPNFAEAHSNLGTALKEQRQFEQAIAHLEQAIALKPDYAEVHNNLGNVLQEQGKLEDAIACYRHALEINPNFAEIHSNLGNMLQQLGQFEAAFDHLQRAIALQPDYAGAYNNLGIALRNHGQFDAAVEAYKTAVELQPDFIEAHWNIALHQLLTGDLGQGFAGYEWRFQWKRYIRQTPPRTYAQPRWDGSSLADKTIFLYAEQGLGDTIQFVRYVSLIAAQGGRAIVECQPPLVTLLQTVRGIAQVIPQGHPIPAFDVHAPLMSLPYILGTSLETIPANVPYLGELGVGGQELGVRSQEPGARSQESTISYLSASPRPRVPASPSASPVPLHIGIAWTGNPENSYNRARTCPLDILLALTDLPGVRFFSLQKEVPAADLPLLQAHPEVQDLREQMTDFIATAQLIQQLDLVISVDTAIAHLAGALGKPVWLLLPLSPDWRWMLDRTDSPWYPTMRLFRQPAYGDWDSVLQQVREDLEKGERKGKREKRKAKREKRKATGGSNAIRFTPTTPSTPSTLPLPEELTTAIRYHQAGNVGEAERLCRQLLQRQEHPEGWHLLGLMAHQKRQFEQAIAHYRRVLELNPNHHDTYNNLAVALQELGQVDEAIAYYQKALALKPDYADAHNNYANALRAKGRLDDAIYHYRQAVALRPDYADAHNNLGLVFYAKGEFQQAAVCYQQAVNLRPTFAQAHNHLGNALKELGDFEQATLCYRQAIACKPDYAKAYNNWGNIHRDSGDLATALQYYDRAIAIEPNFAEAHWNKALTLLMDGDLHQGFAEYEWRWKVNLPSFQAMRPFPGRVWDGSPLNGKTILLHAEQGMGDMLQFARYIPLVAERGGRIILECHMPLVNLLQEIPGVVQVIPYGSSPPVVEVHAPLMSLPYILGTSLETIPANVPYLGEARGGSQEAGVIYLSESPCLRVSASPRLPLSPSPPPPLHIGIVWTGNSENPYNRFRACPLADLLTLTDIPNACFYSLQKEPQAADLELLQAHPEVQDLRHQLTDFVQTARLLNQLDLVISVDTAVTHLAGALGKPVWLLLPFAPDWRWMLKRDDSPWYPSMRIFRQPAPGDWQAVLRQVRAALVSNDFQGVK